jgi:hypothetical protein
MLKQVRKKPRFHSARGVNRGVIYLSKSFVGTKVQVLTAGQYNVLMTRLKQLKHKLFLVRRLLYEHPGA